VTKTPTRSVTHEDIEMRRLSSMGLELEEIAVDGVVQLPALIELAEDRGRPPSHYLAAVALATSDDDDKPYRVEPVAPTTVRVCAGNCQRWGALDVLDNLVERWQKRQDIAIVPVSCLDRCDQAAACEIEGAHGKLVVAPANPANVTEALDTLLH
jgi:NADH:ubiquinone oxidoreductase subunit E